MEFNLRLAQIVESDCFWWIITSYTRSTVCEKQTLFEFNFLALSMPANDCFALACVDHMPSGKELRGGRPLPFESAA